MLGALPCHRNTFLCISPSLFKSSIQYYLWQAWRTQYHIQKRSLAVDHGSTDFNHYTGGRWLQNNHLQTQARYVKFDTKALYARVLQLLPGTNAVVSCERKDGGFNRVFIITVDNGMKVIARFPTKAAGPPRLATASEIATIEFLRKTTEIPIPKVLDWSDNSCNPIGSEYIIMEHAEGVRLNKIWPSMNTLQHLHCAINLSKLYAKISNIAFPAYGSIYFQGAVDSAIPLEEFSGFCVGPHCGITYWNSDPVEQQLYGTRNNNYGPWTNLDSYCRGLVASAASRLPLSQPATPMLSYQGKIEEHHDLHRICKSVIEQLITAQKVQDAAMPTLAHADFHKRNIFVSSEDPTKITAIIDWQSSSIEPALAYTLEEPDFAEYPRDISESEEATDSSKSRASEIEDQLICYQGFDAWLKGHADKLRAARILHESIIRLFRHFPLSYRTGAAALRQDLIDLSNTWTIAGLPGSCPYQPTSDELEKHKPRFEEFLDWQKCKRGLMQLSGISFDGWVQADRWDYVKEQYQAGFKMYMEDCRRMEAEGEEGVTEELAWLFWPWHDDEINKWTFKK